MCISKLYIKCTTEQVKGLHGYQNNSNATPSRDMATLFKRNVCGLCLSITPGGRIDRVSFKVQLPQFSFAYKHCKIFRLALVIREATRLIACNYDTFTPGDMEDCLVFKYSLNIIEALSVAVRFRFLYPENYRSLLC